MKTATNIKKLDFHWELYDPYIFCAHHNDQFPRGTSELGPDPSFLRGRNMGNDFVVKDGFRMYHGDVVPGFPVHPHRGFETVTITLEGLVDHSDSFGAAGRYGNGDVQWMTAGSGIQHSEMFPLLNQEKGNKLELLQVWLNLPAKSKFVNPYYKMLWSEEIPIVKEKDASGLISSTIVISGNYKGTKALTPAPDSWATDPENEVAIWIIRMDANAELKLPSAKGYVSRAVYHYYGNGMMFNESQLPGNHQAMIAADTEITVVNGNEPSTFLLLQGKPIREPVAQYGPFVMNSRTEIQQAYEDYMETRFGGWPWDRNDPVHGNEPKRFAKYIDGSEETRDT